MTYQTGDSPVIDDFAPTIALVETKGGHYYIGPASDSAVIKQAKIDIAENDDILAVYIHEFDEETSMPIFDNEPIWQWDHRTSVYWDTGNPEDGN